MLGQFNIFILYHNMVRATFFIISLAFLLFSCHSSNNEETLLKVVQEWQGKEIKIPSNIVFKSLGQDTLCYYFFNKQHKILVYVDSLSCTSCHLRLDQWKQFMDTINIYKLDISFLFVVNTKYYNDLEFELDKYAFEYPVIYDYRNEFDKLNHFPQEPFRTFLLDKHNKILVVGSPLDDPKIWTLYKKIIQH